MRFLFALALLIVLSIGSTAKEKIHRTNWQQILEIKSTYVKAYYDANGFIKIDSNTKAGTFMLVFSSPQKFNIGEKQITAGTIVKSIIIKCDTGLYAPVMDLYFKSGIPTSNTVPIGGVEYFGNPKDTQQMTTKSIMYKILCGNEV